MLLNLVEGSGDALPFYGSTLLARSDLAPFVCISLMKHQASHGISFTDAIKEFDTRSHAAIRLGDEYVKFILVRYSQHGKTTYSVRKTDG